MSSSTLFFDKFWESVEKWEIERIFKGEIFLGVGLVVRLKFNYLGTYRISIKLN